MVKAKVMKSKTDKPRKNWMGLTEETTPTGLWGSSLANQYSLIPYFGEHAQEMRNSATHHDFYKSAPFPVVLEFPDGSVFDETEGGVVFLDLKECLAANGNTVPFGSGSMRGAK